MQYNAFKNLCNSLGDTKYSEDERWKSIKYIHADNCPIQDFQAMLAAGEITFIDNGEEGPSGFLIYEVSPAEFSTKGERVATFVDLAVVFTVSFVVNPNFKCLADVLYNTYGILTNFDLKFEKSRYSAVDGKVDIGVVAINAPSTATFAIRVFDSEDQANVATSVDDPNAKHFSDIENDVGIYYLKAFLNAPYAGTAITVFEILPSDNTNITYKFINDDGTVIKTDTVDYGEVIIPPAAQPSKEEDAQYVYTFSGWSGYTDGMTATKNVTFRAVFNSEIKKYTYRFIDYDGTVLKSSTVDYGTTIVAPTNPTRESTDQYKYTFVEFDGFTEDMTITHNCEFTAVYRSDTRSYTYTFYDEDGTTVLKSEEALYGNTITPPDTDPVKEATPEFTYEFAGYTGFTEGMTVDGNISFTATYTATVNKYTYTFYDEDGVTVLKSETVNYGTVITPPDTDPVKEATPEFTYEFAGYTGFTEGMTVNGDISFTATYTETAITTE